MVHAPARTVYAPARTVRAGAYTFDGSVHGRQRSSQPSRPRLRRANVPLHEADDSPVLNGVCVRTVVEPLEIAVDLYDALLIDWPPSCLSANKTAHHVLVALAGDHSEIGIIRDRLRAGAIGVRWRGVLRKPVRLAGKLMQHAHRRIPLFHDHVAALHQRTRYDRGRVPVEVRVGRGHAVE